MKQEELPFETLVLDVEKFVGLTPWASAQENPPPIRGWWKTRRKDQPETGSARRFWWPEMKAFSMPVRIGQDDVAAFTAASMLASEMVQPEIEWCGLVVPYPTPAESEVKPAVNEAGPEHLAPKPAPGLEFDHRGVLSPVAKPRRSVE